MKIRIIITLKSGVLDPQGKAVKGALENLGFAGIKDVRVGKVVDLEIDVENKEKVADIVSDMCSKLLVNPVIETYQWDILEE